MTRFGLGLVHAAKPGIGLGPLPTAIADKDQDLVRACGPIPDLAPGWRLLTHRTCGARRASRAFLEFIAEDRAELKSIATG
jgi:DNA-binding transcriptional LysR family regulator